MISELNPEYEEKFKDLLRFEKGSQLKDIIVTKEIAATDTAARGVLSSFGDWLANFTYTKNYISSQLRLKIKDWRTFLDQEAWNCRKNNSNFKDLQCLAKKIFCKQKTEIIRLKLEESGIIDAKLNKSLMRFDEIIRNIVTTPMFQNRSPFVYTPYFQGFLPANITSYMFNRSRPQLRIDANSQWGFQPLLSNSLPQRDLGGLEEEERRPSRTNSPIPEDHLDELEKAYKNNVKLEFLAEKFKKIDRSCDSDWENVLIAAFNALERNEEVAAVASVLSSHQIMVILLHCFEARAQRNRLPYFIASIGFSACRDVLLAKEESEIHKLNQYLQEADEIAQMWLNENLQKLFLGAIHVNNVKKDAIDFIAERFRFRLHWRDITFSDVKDIEVLKDDININWTAIKKLRILLEKIVIHPVREKDLKDLDNEYAIFLARLNEPAFAENFSLSVVQPKISLSNSDPENVGGGIFQIIYGHAFVSLGCDDDYFEGLDIIGKWSIATPIDYFNSGLLANFSQDEVSALQKKHGVSLMHYLASINLRKVGLWYVRDFKKNKIFNRSMLKEFLIRPENLRKLQDDPDPAIKILQAWDVRDANQLINCGLLNNLSRAQQLKITDISNHIIDMITENLNKLGIYNCSDWKREGIYNRVMLKDYMNRLENRLKLVTDQDPPHKMLEIWGLLGAQDFQYVKLCNELTEEQILELNRSPEKLEALIDNQLARVGIRNIRDLKRLKIEDRNTLQEYMFQEPIQKKLGE